MIIDASTIVLTLLMVSVGLYGGLQLIRKFALEIAQENHDAMAILDQRAEEERVRKERAADAAASSAFAKVQPIVTQLAQKQPQHQQQQQHVSKAKLGELRTPGQAPSASPPSTASASLQDMVDSV